MINGVHGQTKCPETVTNPAPCTKRGLGIFQFEVLFERVPEVEHSGQSVADPVEDYRLSQHHDANMQNVCAFVVFGTQSKHPDVRQGR